MDLSGSEDEELLKLIPMKGKTVTLFSQTYDILMGMILPCPACAAREPEEGIVRPCAVCNDKGFLKLTAVEGLFSRLADEEVAESA